jgi:hypothetical protein
VQGRTIKCFKKKGDHIITKKILEDQKKQLDENLEVVNWKLKYYQELEGKDQRNPQIFIAKAHATAFERMAKLLDKKNNKLSIRAAYDLYF